MAVLLAIGLALLGVASAGGPASALARAHSKVPPPSEVTLTAAPGAPGLPIATPPVGLSLEYPVMAHDLGSAPCGPAALSAELLRLGSPPLELGGNSQDMTVPGEEAPAAPSSWEAGTLYPLPASFWSQLHCLLTSAKDPLTVGLNARTGEPSWTAKMVAGAQSAATNGLSFSLGNEPDLYDLPNYSALAKPQAEEEAAAVNLYLRVAGGLQQALGGAPVIGPELARAAHWQHALPQVIGALHMGTVGVHLYPLTDCTSPREVTLGGLLSSRVADSPRSLAWVAADARAAGVPAIISEANSASCGGKAGVSDTPAAAVWAVRFVLSALGSGFQEVRFHFSGDPYDPFLVQGETILDRPLESALVALNQWLPVGSSIRSVAGVRGLTATRALSPTGAPLLVLDNEHAQAQAVLVRGAPSVQTQLLSAARSGLQTRQLTARGGKLKLSVPPNSVLAVSAGAVAAAAANAGSLARVRVGHVELGELLEQGLPVSVSCVRTCTVSIVVQATGGSGRQTTRQLARASAGVEAGGTRTVEVKMNAGARHVLAHLPHLTLKTVTTVRYSGGHDTSMSTIALRR